ncbi:MAG: GNAT family N-acetyltransferase [Pirellulales bacterium]|nr:GNAT family N-acetyltransferase [Pirellulales bacterium]
MKIQPVTLTGRAVQLVPLDKSHAEGLAAIAEPELFVHHFPPEQLTAAGFADQINRLKALSNWRPFAILEMASQAPVGITSYLDIQPANRGLEVGFTWMAKRVQGTKVNPECKLLLLRHAFEDHKAVRVQLKTDRRNLHSQRAIEKLGAVKEGVLRQHVILPDGFLRDTVMYSIIDAEWPAVKARLIERLGYEL